MRACTLMMLTAVLLLPIAGAAQELPLSVTISTDRPAYNPGETVTLAMRLCNETAEVVDITTGMCCFSSGYFLEIIDENEQTVALWVPDFSCLAVPCSYSWQPSVCRTEPAGAPTTWDQSRGHFPTPSSTELVPPGTYRVRATWLIGPWQSYSPPFEIRATTLQNQVPTLSVLGSGCLALGLALLGLCLLRRL